MPKVRRKIFTNQQILLLCQELHTSHKKCLLYTVCVFTAVEYHLSKQLAEMKSQIQITPLNYYGTVSSVRNIESAFLCISTYVIYPAHSYIPFANIN